MYNHQTIEKKWQAKWSADNLYRTREEKGRPKYYVLDMLPYTSGSGLHVGHPKGYIATDALARLRMMQGYNVLHPMGWDAFGLPAENYALENKVHPRLATEKNVATFKRQLELIGFTYDWEREVNTTDPDYYKWTQWTFLQMWKKGLAYESNEPINWCPSCQTGLANEDLEDGRCERCGSEVIQKPIRQWVLRITDYADRLVADLGKLDGWEDSIKDMQRHWIGRKEGINIDYAVRGKDYKLTVFSTRPDTNFGATFIVAAPDSEFVSKRIADFSNQAAVAEYVEAAKRKTELERISEARKKTGVFTGLHALNNLNGRPMPIYVSDFVLASVGSGVVVGVPGHDLRDFEFASSFDLEIIRVVVGSDGDTTPITRPEQVQENEGVMINSGFLNGLDIHEATEKIKDYLEDKGWGKKTVSYKLKNWVFSRQRYWGEPIPLIHCEKCGVVAVPEEDLPVPLPEVKSYEPTGTGESPLAAISDWVNVKCPKCGGPAKRETNTMPQWAGSCWYYLRYIDPKNDEAIVDKKKERYWSPVDFYVGGAEHATRHLIYARFWHKFLYDIGAVSYDEPFTKLKHVGLIMGEDGRKMSKRWGNVINPDEVVAKQGADALRVYEMFMGPFDQAIAWSTNGLVGTRKFLDKVAALFGVDEGAASASASANVPENKKILSLLHKTIKKVGEDIESFHFNTAVSALMILVNALTDHKNEFKVWPINQAEQGILIQLLAPFAPHLSEEIWSRLGNQESIFKSAWPAYDKKLIKDEIINLVIQVNGKLRASREAPANVSEADAFALAQADANVGRWLADKTIIKKIFIPGKLLNIVIK